VLEERIMKIKLWSKEEDEKIIKLYKKMTISSIYNSGEIKDRSSIAIGSRLRYLRKQGAMIPYHPHHKSFNEYICSTRDMHMLVIKLRDDGFTYSQIGKITGYCVPAIPQILYVHRYLQKGGINSPRVRKIENDKKTIEYMNKIKVGTYEEVTSHLGLAALQRLKSNRKIFQIKFHKRTRFTQKAHKEIFKPEYKGVTYFCNSRTDMVRLAAKAILHTENQWVKHRISSFLSNYFTDAEMIAIGLMSKNLNTSNLCKQSIDFPKRTKLLKKLNKLRDEERLREKRLQQLEDNFLLY
jgi:hypothetical protein